MEIENFNFFLRSFAVSSMSSSKGLLIIMLILNVLFSN